MRASKYLIATLKETPADAESYVGMADKYDKYFSENPGK